MSEPYLPYPDPEPDAYWDPSPPRCGECGEILSGPHPAMRKDGRIEGWCQKHGTVPATYRISDSEMPTEKERP